MATASVTLVSAPPALIRQRTLAAGVVLTVTLVAFESLAVATIMPEVKDSLGGLSLYGWVFSAFFLGNLVGNVAAGELADHLGLLTPLVIGLVLFAAGLALGGAATSMPTLIAARTLQGLGGGALPAICYTAVGRGVPHADRPRMFAIMSTSWVVPGLVGPVVASFISHLTSWRWVFWGLLPLVGLAALVMGPVLTRFGPPDGRPTPVDRRHMLRGALLAAAVALAFAAMRWSPWWARVAGLVVSLPIGLFTFASLTPKGTLRAAVGVPATVASRGIMNLAFFSADAFVPLMLVDGRGRSQLFGGIALTVGSVSWACGSWAQSRLLTRFGPRRMVQAGLGLIAFGIGGLVGVALGLPPLVVMGTWALAGFGMGLSYSPQSVTVLGAAAPGQQGKAASGLQLSDLLGTSVGTAAGGVVVAWGAARHLPVSQSTAWVFALSVLISVVALGVAARLPRDVPSGPPDTD